MPATRTHAQIEAARRNGAKSRGPVTPEGKARSAKNALTHGLAAKGHVLLGWEDPQAWDELVAALVEEHAPGTETESRLVLRLAAALWRQDRADRLERRMYDAAPRPEYYVGGRPERAHPEETFDLARCNAIRSYRNQASLEASRVLRELRLLRAEREENEPEQAGAAGEDATRGPSQPPTRPGRDGEAEGIASAPALPANEPGRRAPPAANGNAPSENEPDLTFEERLEVERMLASGDPAQIVEGARRAGVLHAVVDVLGRARRRA